MTYPERFIRDGDRYPVHPLMRMALLHYRVEAFHPFCDGNGRTGRVGDVLSSH